MPIKATQNTQKNLKIVISLPSVTQLTLTGAAARSAASADASAQQWLAKMQASADRLAAALSRNPDATAIAEAIRATEAYHTCWSAANELAPRWRSASAAVIVITGLGARGKSVFEDVYWALDGGNTMSCASTAATRYRDALIAAGVPMMGDGCSTAQYWDDAAARGC